MLMTYRWLVGSAVKGQILTVVGNDDPSRCGLHRAITREGPDYPGRKHALKNLPQCSWRVPKMSTWGGEPEETIHPELTMNCWKYRVSRDRCTDET